METVNTYVLALVRQAIADPGATLPREDGETVPAWSARAVLAVIEEHPVLELRPYYPTQDAYDAACKALEKHRQRADRAEAVIKGIRDRHHRRHPERHGSGCVSCGRLWPCPDYQDADAALSGGEASC